MVRCSSVRLELIQAGSVIHVVALVHGETETDYYVFTQSADLTDLVQLPEFLTICLRGFKEMAEIAETGQPSN